MEISSETEQKIFQAAVDVFREKGKDGARMGEIAGRAGLNKALLHYYFRSKDKLYQHVFRKEVMLFFSTLLNSIQPGGDIRQFLKDFIYIYIDQLQQNPLVPRFILWEINRGGRQFKQVLEELINSQPHNTPLSLVQRIQQAVDTGELRPLHPQHLFFSIVGMSIFVFVAQPVVETIFTDLKVMDDAFLEKRKEEIFNLVWRGVKP